MMDKATAAELIQASALGCLDNSEKKELNEYLDLGGEFPWKEFGEYQNLSSLLPIILELNIPDSSVKDKVARRIYDAIEEQKAQKSLSRGLPKADEDLIYPETTVLGEPVKESKLTDYISDELVDQVTTDPITDEIPMTAHGGLSNEPPIVEDGFTIKNPAEENLSIPELETFIEPFPDETIKSDVTDKSNIDNYQSEPEINKAGDINSEMSESSSIDNEAKLKMTPTQGTNTPVKSKYQSLLEEKSKKRQTTEFSDEKITLQKKVHEDIPLKKERFAEPEKPVKKNISGLVVDIIIYVLLLAAIAFVYLKLSSEIETLKKELNELRRDLGVVSFINKIDIT